MGLRTKGVENRSGSGMKSMEKWLEKAKEASTDMMMMMMMMMYSYSDMTPAVGRPMRAKLSKLYYMENLLQV